MSNPVKGYVGWALDPQQRTHLLQTFPTKYARVIAHHVTLRVGVTSDVPLPQAHEGMIVGVADDQMGVQALVVAIGGTVRRPDGGRYHITWSLAQGRKPVESNHVIAQQGWDPVDPVQIQLIPTFFPHKS